MTIRILFLALLTVILGASPPVSPDPPPKNPDIAFANAMKAREERARLKAAKVQKSLSETLSSDETTPAVKKPIIKSAWKQRPEPSEKPKRQVWVIRREIISPTLRASFTGTRRFCYGKCGR